MHFSKIFAIAALAATSAQALPTADANSNLAVRAKKSPISTVLTTLNTLLTTLESSAGTLAGQATGILTTAISDIEGLLGAV